MAATPCTTHMAPRWYAGRVSDRAADSSTKIASWTAREPSFPCDDTDIFVIQSKLRDILLYS